jgi:uncharacterized RDD family membrane protein YckC
MESPLRPDDPRAEPPGEVPAAPTGGPQAPTGGPQAPSTSPEAPGGGWQQPVPQQQAGFSGQPLASWGARAGAFFLDALILLIPAVVLTLVIIAIAAGSDVGAILTGVLGFLAYLVVALIYAPVLMSREGASNGQTWGKQILGLRVVRDSGERVGFGWAALREIAVKGLAVSIAASIIPVIPWFLNFFWPLWDDENRALHDMVVSSHVVRA